MMVLLVQRGEVGGFSLWSPGSEMCGSLPVNEVILPDVVFGAIEKMKEVGGVW